MLENATNEDFKEGELRIVLLEACLLSQNHESCVYQVAVPTKPSRTSRFRHECNATRTQSTSASATYHNTLPPCVCIQRTQRHEQGFPSPEPFLLSMQIWKRVQRISNLEICHLPIPLPLLLPYYMSSQKLHRRVHLQLE